MDNDPKNSLTRSATVIGAPSGADSAPGAGSLNDGLVLAGRFRIVRWIARGGMGDVYEAEDSELGGRVAIKTIRLELAGSESALERFKREIALARKVSHPNVCRIFDLYRDERGANGSPCVFLAMELLSGPTLAEEIKRRGRFSTADALPIVKQVAMGLNAAHRAGVIHRDLKSLNIMLAADAAAPGGTRAVLTDFGLARPVEGNAAITTQGMIVGSPAYMAPEQVEGREAGAPADIYAFGAVMYEMVTGRPPFDGDNPMMVAVKRLTELPDSPRKHVPDLDIRWESAILRCLEKDPAERFRTLPELLTALTSGAPAAPAAKAAPPPPQPPPAAVLAPAAAPGAGGGGPPRAALCPKCQRMLPGYVRCPVCNVETVIPQSIAASDAHLDGLRKKVARAESSRRAGRLIGTLMMVAVPLLLVGAGAVMVLWPVPPPGVRTPGEAEMAAFASEWAAFQDSIRYGRPAHIEIDEARLNHLARTALKNPALTIRLGPPTAVYFPGASRLAISRRVDCAISYDKAQLAVASSGGAMGRLPLAQASGRDLLAPLLTRAKPLLKDVTSVKIENGVIRLDAVPQTMALPNGNPGWIIIDGKH